MRVRLLAHVHVRMREGERRVHLVWRLILHHGNRNRNQRLLHLWLLCGGEYRAVRAHFWVFLFFLICSILFVLFLLFSILFCHNLFLIVRKFFFLNIVNYNIEVGTSEGNSSSNSPEASVPFRIFKSDTLMNFNICLIP
jgi:hypothetical protein